MHDDIELFADATLVMLMLFIGTVLVQADPILPTVWALATVFMTWQHHKP